ncbi:hypothetical protein MKZ38_001934 [Zalerion maritima]|uniref:Uncharacterized protein n=1 Tax=Zalerion maritima TaxID=339359 RepID=A0AAD5WTI2_9PEZI|nr:hypothetical protein MKZ38_001934 [Zalerion maritima]
MDFPTYDSRTPCNYTSDDDDPPSPSYSTYSNIPMWLAGLFSQLVFYYLCAAGFYAALLIFRLVSRRLRSRLNWVLYGMTDEEYARAPRLFATRLRDLGADHRSWGGGGGVYDDESVGEGIRMGQGLGEGGSTSSSAGEASGRARAGVGFDRGKYPGRSGGGYYAAPDECFAIIGEAGSGDESSGS